MTQSPLPLRASIGRDVVAGSVVFLVALPLCLGVALASNAPLFSGILAGIVGGLVVGLLSRSHTSVSGPAAGLTAVVAAQIALLGSFEAFLLAVFIAGVIQVVAGLFRAGFIALFVPTSVVKGLLTAIGVILILKQIPHLVGHDADPEGDASFSQPDGHNTFSELFTLLEGQWHLGAATIGLISIVLLVLWGRIKFLKNSPVPAPLIVVLAGLGLSRLFAAWGGKWVIQTSHLVQVETAESVREFGQFLTHPDFSMWMHPPIYVAAVTIAIVASLETLLNLDAVDRLDPQQRHSPPSRELFAQGVGNMVSGLIGGIPVTSVIIRSSVGINSGGATKLTTIFHGVLLLGCVMFLPQTLNLIPLSCLAGVLLVTGFKLASPDLVRQMYREGKYQFAPYVITVVGIVFTDLLIGILIGLAVSVSFILYSNVKRPLRRVLETHVGGEVLRIELANQVSFLNRAAIERALIEIPRGGHVLIDAEKSVYIDPDVLGLLQDYKNKTAPARGVAVSFRGFREKYQLEDHIQYVDYSTRELQERLTPDQVMELLRAGNERFRTGETLRRDTERGITATAAGQHPLAVVLSCMDSRTPAELVFDMGLGDVFSVRVAGNIISPEVTASIEYGCCIAGAPLVVVMGHSRCGAVGATVRNICSSDASIADSGCRHLEYIVDEIAQSIDSDRCRRFENSSAEEQQALIDEVGRRNVFRSVESLLEQSDAVRNHVERGEAAVVGAMYDVTNGRIEFLNEESQELQLQAGASEGWEAA